jgi:hypothetical protein
VEAELFRADRQTDRQDEAHSLFRNFTKAPKKHICDTIRTYTHLHRRLLLTTGLHRTTTAETKIKSMNIRCKFNIKLPHDNV